MYLPRSPDRHPLGAGRPKSNSVRSPQAGGEKRGAHRTGTCQVTWEAEPSILWLHNDIPMHGTMHNILDTIKNMPGQAVATDCGENPPPQCTVLAACKSEAAISLCCAAGIRTKANPKCFVILLSSNPVSISGHSINRIRARLKVRIGAAGPGEQALRGQTQPPLLSPICLQAPRASPAQPFGAAARAARAQHQHLLPLQSLCAVNGWSDHSTAVRAFHVHAQS